MLQIWTIPEIQFGVADANTTEELRMEIVLFTLL